MVFGPILAQDESSNGKHNAASATGNLPIKLGTFIVPILACHGDTKKVCIQVTKKPFTERWQVRHRLQANLPIADRHKSAAHPQRLAVAQAFTEADSADVTAGIRNTDIGQPAVTKNSQQVFYI